MYLGPHQEFTTNIAEHAYGITSDSEKNLKPYLWTNADSSGNKKLLISPDTDVYYIGLTVAERFPDYDIIIQLNTKTAEAKFVNLKTLLTALASDPDLAGIPIHLRAQALQSLYVCTGCDYIY